MWPHSLVYGTAIREIRAGTAMRSMRTGRPLVHRISSTNNSLILNPFPLSIPAKLLLLPVSSTRGKNHAHDSCRNQPPQPPISNPEQNKGENRPGFVFTNPEAGAELPQLVYKNQETGLTIKLLIDSAGIVMYI
jgi:hypothetical protein